MTGDAAGPVPAGGTVEAAAAVLDAHTPVIQGSGGFFTCSCKSWGWGDLRYEGSYSAHVATALAAEGLLAAEPAAPRVENGWCLDCASHQCDHAHEAVGCTECAHHPPAKPAAPEGTTVTEWVIARRAHGRLIPTSSAHGPRWNETTTLAEARDEWYPGQVVAFRQRTTYPDTVTDWTEATDD